MVGWWAISSWLPAYTQQLAKAQHYANFVEWGNRAAILYTIGAVTAYLSAGFLIDAIGRNDFRVPCDTTRIRTGHSPS
jgi:hypothetical protein